MLRKYLLKNSRINISLMFFQVPFLKDLAKNIVYRKHSNANICLFNADAVCIEDVKFGVLPGGGAAPVYVPNSIDVLLRATGI